MNEISSEKRIDSKFSTLQLTYLQAHCIRSSWYLGVRGGEQCAFKYQRMASWWGKWQTLDTERLRFNSFPTFLAKLRPFCAFHKFCAHCAPLFCVDDRNEAGSYCWKSCRKIWIRPRECSWTSERWSAQNGCHCGGRSYLSFLPPWGGYHEALGLVKENGKKLGFNSCPEKNTTEHVVKWLYTFSRLSYCKFSTVLLNMIFSLIEQNKRPFSDNSNLFLKLIL